MTKYYLGLDGGGSKTHGALFSRDGRLVDFIEWGTTSHEFLPGGYSGLKIELKRMFGSIQSRNGLHWEDVSCVYGLAGVDCEKQSALIGGYIRECGVSSCLLCNDSLLGIKAASETGWGICSVNGSGTGASGIDINGRVHTVGGLFGLSGDYAGGRVLGSEAVRLVYEQLFRGGEYTVLRFIFSSFFQNNLAGIPRRVKGARGYPDPQRTGGSGALGMSRRRRKTGIFIGVGTFPGDARKII